MRQNEPKTAHVPSGNRDGGVTSEHNGVSETQTYSWDSLDDRDSAQENKG